MSHHKKQLSALLNEEISRGEFLKLVCAGILGVIGISALLQNMAQSAQPTLIDKPSGYGNSPYGR